MKILFFIDTHGSPSVMRKLKEKAKNADLLVCGGDFTIFENEMTLILQEFNKWNRPIILIHGNHETSSSTKAECEGLKNLHFIHKTYFIIEDLIFYGYGGGGFSTIDSKFTTEAESFMQELKKIEESNHKKYRFVLVTHAPPYGTYIDDKNEYEGHVGNKSIKEFIIKYHPILAMSGHIHETSGMEDTINNIKLINPGPEGMLIDL
jgi:Icc-related predicted phosphoesterase